MNLLILFSKSQHMRSGVQTISGKQYEEAVRSFPELGFKDSEKPVLAIGACGNKSECRSPAYLLKITGLQRAPKALKVFYCIADILDVTSEEAIRIALHYLKGEGKLKGDLPVFSILDDLSLEGIKNPKMNRGSGNRLTLLERLQHLKSLELWYKMVDPFRPLTKLEENNPKVWNDPKVLREVAYATKQLASVPEIPPEARYDFSGRSAFLKEKRLLREDAVFLLKRAMVLDPDNPVYISDQAGLHANNVKELMTRRGRTDGNALFELKQSIACFDKALSLGPNRIADLYAKGHLLTMVYLELIHKSDGAVDEDKLFWLQEGIKALEKLVNLWTGFKDYVEQERQLKNKYKKEYIRSLFYLGLAYDQLVAGDWLATDIYLGIYGRGTTGLAQDVAHAERALQYFIDCWNAECETGCLPKDGLATFCSGNWVVKGADKLFYLGYMNLKCHILYNVSGLRKESREVLVEGEVFLLEALKTFLPATSRSVSKEHVVEALAKTYLSSGKVDKAVQAIRQHCHIRRLKGETAVVYALANILLGKHNEAENILEKIALERADRTGLHAVFLLGMSHLEQGKANEASVLFKNALRHRFKHDAMAKTYLYIGLTETEIKAGNKRNALMYCRKVSEIEAYKDYADKKREQIRKKH